MNIEVILNEYEEAMTKTLDQLTWAIEHGQETKFIRAEIARLNDQLKKDCS